jgi:anti-sigma regulatory factor (Ser/Thr protein kinase)
MEPDRPEPGSVSGGTNGGSGDGKPDWSARAAAAAGAARSAGVALKPVAARFGDWLARIGWGKFFLLAVLLMILGSISTSLIFRHLPVLVIDEEEMAVQSPKVSVDHTKDGLRIKAEDGTDKAKIKVDRKGVRIDAKDKDDQVEVVIDDTGVHVKRADPAPAGKAQPGPSSTTESAAADKDEVTISSADLADPAKAEAAVAAARKQIDKIVGEQVARRTRQTQMKRGDWTKSFLLLLIFALVFVKIAMGSKRKAETKAQAATATAAEESLKRQLAEAELKTMQAQVEPHFLFNTLASVDYLIETDPQRASMMQKNLIQYLRAALPKMREASSTLAKEVDLCRAYLAILKVRMEDRLQVAITVPKGLESAVFPPMMLQTLVENAIKHGLEPKDEGGTLSLSADFADGKLRVTVADTGLGLQSVGNQGMGVGLANVRERLAAL